MVANNDVVSLFPIDGNYTIEPPLGVLQICHCEREIPPSPRCKARRWQRDDVAVHGTGILAKVG